MILIKVFLCRHGRTEHNKNGIVQGHKDVELSEEGEHQARKLAEALKENSIGYIYSSPLLRAQETAEIIANKLGRNVETMEALKEVDQGVYEGKDSRKMMEDMWNAEAEDHKWAPEEGESMEETRERAISCLKELKKDHKEEKIVIVAHGGFNKTMILGALGHSSKNFNRIRQENCCINKISVNKDLKWVVESVNYTDHLD